MIPAWKDLLLVAAVLTVAGCSAQRPVLYPNEHYNSVEPSVAQSDVDECMARAEEFVKSGGPDKQKAKETAKQTAYGGASGAAIGAVAGAVVVAARVAERRSAPPREPRRGSCTRSLAASSALKVRIPFTPTSSASAWRTRAIKSLAGNRLAGTTKLGEARDAG